MHYARIHLKQRKLGPPLLPFHLAELEGVGVSQFEMQVANPNVGSPHGGIELLVGSLNEIVGV